MRVEIRGMEEVQRLLRNLSEREVQYATFVGTNRIAYAVMQAQRQEVPRVFQGPTRFIQTGVRYEKMTSTRRYARAYWTEERNPYIEPHVIGGARAVKKIENVYRGKGILPAGRWMTPGPGAPLNAYGNLTKTFSKKLFEAAESFATRKKYGDWFVTKSGIFQRKGGSLEPLIFFAREPQYQKRYKFYETAIAEANRVAPEIMRAAIAKAIERSRG
jgi:hypothetical protein